MDILAIPNIKHRWATDEPGQLEFLELLARDKDEAKAAYHVVVWLPSSGWCQKVEIR